MQSRIINYAQATVITNKEILQVHNKLFKAIVAKLSIWVHRFKRFFCLGSVNVRTTVCTVSHCEKCLMCVLVYIRTTCIPWGNNGSKHRSTSTWCCFTCREVFGVLCREVCKCVCFKRRPHGLQHIENGGSRHRNASAMFYLSWCVQCALFPARSMCVCVCVCEGLGGLGDIHTTWVT